MIKRSARWAGVAALIVVASGCGLDGGEQSSAQAGDVPAQNSGLATSASGADEDGADGAGVAPRTAAVLVELPPVSELPEDVSIADPSAFRAIAELTPEELERTMRESTSIESASTGLESLTQSTEGEGK